MFQKAAITHMYEMRAPIIREASMSRTINKLEIAILDFLRRKFFPCFLSLATNHIHSRKSCGIRRPYELLAHVMIYTSRMFDRYFSFPHSVQAGCRVGELDGLTTWKDTVNLSFMGFRMEFICLPVDIPSARHGLHSCYRLLDNKI